MLNKQQRRRKKLALEWWLQLDNLHLLNHRFSIPPARYIINFEKPLYSKAGEIKKILGKRSRMVIWSLPPIIPENDYGRIQKQIHILLSTGFRSFQISHVSQTMLFTDSKVHLFGDYTVNVMNSEALQECHDLSLQAVIAAIELDKNSLQEIATAKQQLPANSCPLLGVYAYGTPPLYTARLSHPAPLEKELLSPRKENYIVHKKDGYAQTCPVRPFSLLEYIDELQEIGINYIVVDTCNNSRKKDIAELDERLIGSRRYGKLSTFNYCGNLW